MNFDEAQDLPGVNKSLSQQGLKGRCTLLIKNNQPDVGLDKKAANRLEVDIIEDPEYLKKYREAEQWAEKDASKTQQESTSKQQPNNNYDQKSYSENERESEINKTPLELNLFWDPSLVFNYCLLPECFEFLEIKNRFPDRKEVSELFCKLIQKHHPLNNNDDLFAKDQCQNIYLAYCAVILIRDQEGWSQESLTKQADNSNKKDSHLSESTFQSDQTYYQIENPRSSRSRSSDESTISLCSNWWPNTPIWFKVVSTIAILAVAYNIIKPEIWANTEYGRKKWISEVVNVMVANEFTAKCKISVQDVEFDKSASGDVRTGQALLTVEPFFNNRKINFKSSLNKNVDNGKTVYKMDVAILDGFSIYEQPEIKIHLKKQEEKERMIEMIVESYIGRTRVNR